MTDCPVATATYCWPSNRYVIGDAFQSRLAWKPHNRLPVRASAASNDPSSSQKKTRPPAVPRTPPQRLRVAELRQFPGRLPGMDIEGAQNLPRIVVGDVSRRSAHVTPSGLPFEVALRVDAALLERLHVVKPGFRAERGGKPVRGALDGWADLRAGHSGHLIGKENRPAVGSDPARPGQFLHERLGQQQFP